MLCRPDGLYHIQVIPYPDKWSYGIPLKGDYCMSQHSPWAHWCIYTILTKNSCIHSHLWTIISCSLLLWNQEPCKCCFSCPSNGLSESVSLQYDKANPPPHTHTHTQTHVRVHAQKISCSYFLRMLRDHASSCLSFWSYMWEVTNSTIMRKW